MPTILEQAPVIRSDDSTRTGRETTCPVTVSTRATKLFIDGKSQQVIDHLTKLPPLERLGQPEDVANVVAFLAGKDGGWLNGQVLRANGGII